MKFLTSSRNHPSALVEIEVKPTLKFEIVGLSDKELNPTNAKIKIRVVSGVLKKEKLALSINGEYYFESTTKEDNWFVFENVLVEGINDLTIIGQDQLGETHELQATFVAGSKNLPLKALDETGKPVSGFSVKLRIEDIPNNRKFEFENFQTSGSDLNISNAPDGANVLVIANSGDEKFGVGEFTIEGSQKTLVLYQRGELTETPNNDFSSGFLGWDIKGAAPIIGQQGDEKTMRIPLEEDKSTVIRYSFKSSPMICLLMFDSRSPPEIRKIASLVS